MSKEIVTIEELRALRGQYQVKNKEISEFLGYENGWGERFISKILNENEYASQEMLGSIKKAILTISQSRNEPIVA